MRIIAVSLIVLFFTGYSWAQGCCSGGAGSPIAGGAATGVLQKNQVELSANYQWSQSKKFFTEDRDTTALFDRLNTNYLYFRGDYGLTDKLTFSVATGYFIDKTLVEFENQGTTSSGGFGDLIIFPRYDVFNNTNGNIRTEVTLGLGLKIPLGSHNDSTLIFSSPTVGDIYAITPPTIQATNGSHDFMFYSFIYRGYTNKKLRLFLNMLYIKKGYNSLGQKFGDYASIGFFVGKTIFKKLGLTGQIRGEWIAKMKAAKDVDLLAKYNVEQVSTGGKKVFFVPQISYTHKSLTLFVTSEIPLYQYLEGTQVGSQFQITSGLTYRFFAKEPTVELKEDH